MRRRWIGQYLLTISGIAVVVAAVVLPLRVVWSSRRPAPVSSPAPAGGPEVRLFALPATIVRACRQADAGASSPIVCPSHLPRPERASPARKAHPPVEAVLLRVRGRVHGLELGYGVPRDRSARNRPDRFLHFVILWGRAAESREVLGELLGERDLGGFDGRLFRGSPAGSHQDHLVFAWTDAGTRYAASLHQWDSTTETIALLDGLVRTLSSPSSFG